MPPFTARKKQNNNNNKKAKKNIPNAKKTYTCKCCKKIFGFGPAWAIHQSACFAKSDNLKKATKVAENVVFPVSDLVEPMNDMELEPVECKDTMTRVEKEPTITESDRSDDDIVVPQTLIVPLQRLPPDTSGIQAYDIFAYRTNKEYGCAVRCLGVLPIPDLFPEIMSLM